MRKSGWLEQHTRIPFAGIIAMVLVVAVVAVFLKLQMDSLFPESEVKVQSEQEANNALTGMVTASFQGMRKVPLTEVNRLSGMLHQTDRQLKFTVDQDILFIEDGGLKEEFVLESGLGYKSASFDYKGKYVRVDIFSDRNFLFFIEPGRSGPVRVALANEKSFQGNFQYMERLWQFQYYPGGNYVLIDGGSNIRLVRKGDLYVGTWFERGRSHPIRVDPVEQVATIEEVW